MSEVVQGSLSHLAGWERQYVLGLLESEHKSPSALASGGWSGHSASYGCRLLKREAKPYERSRLERLRLAPRGMY